jgi:superfamily II DNA helicase RecQ
VPGVGPVVAERWGRRLLEALADGAGPVAPEPAAGSSGLGDALREWRRRRARELGRPEFVVASDALLAALASDRPGTREALARLPGVGPRFLAAEADALLALLARG